MSPKNLESLNFELFNSLQQWHLSGSPAAGVSCAAWLSACGVPHSLREVGSWSPLSATHGRTPRCVVRAEMQKEWHTPPEVVTSQFRDSASASEILERLGQERNNPGLNLINIGTSWEGLPILGIPWSGRWRRIL